MHALLRSVGSMVLVLGLAGCDAPAGAEPLDTASGIDAAADGRGGSLDSLARVTSAEASSIASDAIEAENEPALDDDVTDGVDAIEDEEPEQPAGFHFAFTHDRTYVVLRTRTEEAWGVGPLALAQREGPTVVVRDVDTATLPPEVIEAASQRMVLRHGSDVVCVAELGAPQLLRRAYASWAQNAEWNGENDSPRASDDEVASEGWDIAVDSEVLVAEAIATSGDCAIAHWAHAEAAPPGIESAGASIAEWSILRAFRRLEGHRDFQAAWADARQYDDDPEVEVWDARPGAHRTIATFQSASGHRYALVSALAHDGCGDFTGGLWALFQQTSQGLALVVSEYSMSSPRTLADVDGDGTPEVIHRDGIVRADGASVDIATPYFDCPC